MSYNPTANVGISRRNLWIAVGLVIALQSAALIWMIVDRVMLLRSGKEVTVEVVPVDPRDIFRGEYVVLGYSFTGTGDTVMPAGTKRGDRVYSVLRRSRDEPKVDGAPNVDAPSPNGGQTQGSKWVLVSVARSYPDKIEPGETVLSGIASDIWRNAEKAIDYGRIRYGIETYFVPEGKGRALEEMVRDKKIEAVLAVGATGQAAIKALMIDGKRVHKEPLF